MSLIDDALKRAQAAGEAPAGKPGGRPWIPTPMPDAGLARRRAVTRWMGIAAAVAVVASAGVWLYRREPSGYVPLRSATGRGEGRSAAAISGPATATPVEVEVATPVVPKHRPTRLPLPAGEDRSEGSPVPASPPAPAAPAPRSAQGLVDGRTYAGSVTLPGGGKIELGGIVWSETEPRALLNDRIAAVGAYVEGFTVVSIGEDRVVLEKDGLTITLSVK